MTDFELELRSLIKDTKVVVDEYTTNGDVDPLAWDLMVKLDAYHEVLELFLKGSN